MVSDHIHHKRSRPSHSDEKASKKRKIIDERVNMDALAFQTPHPNLEAQGVVYKLPSSSPKPSPGPLSPVPPVPVSKKKERSKHARSRTGPNATSTPVRRRNEITPPSFNLSSTDYRRAFRKDDSSRSASRSSKSATSSRASSRECGSRKPQPLHHQPASQLKHAKSLGALDGDNLLPLANSKKYGSKSKSKGTKRTTLESPYVSRASSPVQLEKAKKAHISTLEATIPKRKKQSHILGPPLALPGSGDSPLGLTDTYFNANLPSIPRQNRDKMQRYKTHIHDKTPETHCENTGSKSKSSSKRKSAKGAENQLPVAVTAKSSNLERRPSAPSGLTLPRSQRPVLQPSRLRNSGDNQGRKADHPRNHPDDKPSLEVAVEPIKGTANPATTHRPSTGLRPAASMQELHPKDQAKLPNDARRSNQRGFSGPPDRNDAHTAWMYSRGGVDFNRAPSQLDVSIGIEHEGDADHGSWSSSSSEEDDYLLPTENNRFSLGHDFGFGLNNNSNLDLDLEVVDSFLYANERTLGRLSSESDDDAFAKGIQGISTPSNLQVRIKSQIDEKANRNPDLRETASFPPPPFYKLSDSSPIENAQEGLHRTISRSNSQGCHPRHQLPLDAAHKPSKDERDEKIDLDGEQDMELTEGVNSQSLRLNPGDSHQQSASSTSIAHEEVTWITDSLISPPTAYIRQKNQNDTPSDSSKCDDNNRNHSNTRSTTPSDSIITSASHESPVVDNTTAGEHHAAEHNDSEEPIVVARSATKRTRSGTIMPASPGTLSRGGARRTRSGTIIGPIVASAAATAAENGSRLAGGISSLINTVVGTGKTRQTRSGTIVASASINAMPTSVTDSGIGMSISNGGRQQNRARSGSMLRIVPKAIFQPMTMQNANAQPDDACIAAGANTLIDPEVLATVQEVGGFVDSAYSPPSTPDELNLIFAPCCEEDEDGLHEEWRVAAEPPSPSAPKKRGKGGNGGGGSGHAIMGLAARAASAGRWLKSKSSKTTATEGGRIGKGLRARFEPGVGGSGPEDEIENEVDGPSRRAGVVSSDDELLLVPGATALLFR